MHNLLDVIPCGVLLFGDDGKIRKVNGTLRQLLEYDEGELCGQSVDVIFSLATRIFYNTHFFPLIKLRSRADEIFMTLLSKSNAAIPVLTNAVRHETDEGPVNVAVLMPVVERQKYEQEIVEARRVAENALKENKELQRLTESLESHSRALEQKNQQLLNINEDLVQFHRIVSHDLQEPIRKIRLFCGLIMRAPDSNRSDRDNAGLEKIGRAAERLSLLTAGLQQYVSAQDEVQPVAVNLNDCLSAAITRMEESRGDHQFELAADRLPEVEGYRAQLELLFFHLLDNAVQFRKPEGPLKITVRHTLFQENLYRSVPGRYKFEEHVRIVFSDNGMGFDNQYKDYVFDFGKRVHTNGDGIGMGLALIRKIVVNHGGTISIESEEGSGTDVIILLPLYAFHVPSPPEDNG